MGFSVSFTHIHDIVRLITDIFFSFGATAIAASTFRYYKSLNLKIDFIDLSLLLTYSL